MLLSAFTKRESLGVFLADVVDLVSQIEAAHLAQKFEGAVEAYCLTN